MSTLFRPQSIETDYAFLDACPEALLPILVALPFGALQQRIQGMLAWRAALLSGRLPDEASWPPGHVAARARKALSDMDVVRFCKGQTELVDALLPDILDSFRRASDDQERDILAELRALEAKARARQVEALERQRAVGANRKHKRNAQLATGPLELDTETQKQLRKQARRAVLERAAADGPDAGLLERWGEQARVWAEIADVFGDLGNMLGRGWDLSLGILKQTGWRDLTRLRELVAKLPQLSDVVRSLGRLHHSEGEPSVAETVMVRVQRMEEERKEIRVPYIPTETRGLERSAEVTRMLPAEAVLLGHPALRMLWHARRAERGLMTYRVEGIEVEINEVLVDREEEREQHTPRPERGPIIAVVDTSGSMQGTPERVAKALVLEALRTAHAENRRCLVFLFSGPGQVEEQELSLAPDGIVRLLAFIQLSFGGGTDESAVLARVLKRLNQNDWRKADVLFVTDGEWSANAKVVRDVDTARERGTRFHGVQIGNLGKTGLHGICDPVHVFQDWAAVEGWERSQNP